MSRWAIIGLSVFGAWCFFPWISPRFYGGFAFNGASIPYLWIIIAVIFMIAYSATSGGKKVKGRR
jgi:cell division protein FtsX